MVDRYTNWAEQTDFPDGFPDCGVLQRTRRTVRTATTTFFFCQGEGREFESRHPLDRKPCRWQGFLRFRLLLCVWSCPWLAHGLPMGFRRFRG